MTLVMVVHAFTGSAAVCAGTMALVLSKGSSQHRLAGSVFVGSILMMGPVVAVGAWLMPGSISLLGILFVCFIDYLVLSAWSTIHRSEHLLAPLDLALPVIALCISIAGLTLGLYDINDLTTDKSSPPAEAYFFFAFLALVAMLLDVHNLRIGGVSGKHRIIRHVWRMSFALFFATSTLFTGPGSIIFPEPLRGNPAFLIPQILVVILALFWIYRLLFSERRFSGSNAATTIDSDNHGNFQADIDNP